MKELFEEIIDWVKDSQDTITINTFSKWFEATKELYDVVLKYMPSVNFKEKSKDDTHTLLLMNFNLIVGIIVLDWEYKFLESTYEQNGINITQHLSGKKTMRSNKPHKKSKSVTEKFSTPKEMIEYLEFMVKQSESIEEKERKRAEYGERKRKNQADMMTRKKSNTNDIERQSRYNPDGTFNNGRYRMIAVNQYDMDGNFIKYWEDYHQFECKQVGSIMANCKGKINSAYGYIWKYAEDKNNN